MARGIVVIDRERCKGCALCVGVCPKGILRMDTRYNSRGYRPVLFDDPTELCTGCAICAVICPDVVFTVFREQKVRITTSTMLDFGFVSYTGAQECQTPQFCAF